GPRNCNGEEKSLRMAHGIVMGRKEFKNGPRNCNGEEKSLRMAHGTHGMTRKEEKDNFSGRKT
ncbi:MAG TPA: hypothetical protein VKN82_00160, partial [Desulfohalobiaceae bacterium]|nr:hypothetical protein [Desulfohalobiaceae bacterium]